MRKINKRTTSQVIKSNAGHLASGTVITEDQLCQWFNITKPQTESMNFNEARKQIQAFQFAKLSAYTSLNKELRYSGRVISQVKENYLVRVGAEACMPVINSSIKRISTLNDNVNTLRASF